MIPKELDPPNMHSLHWAPEPEDGLRKPKGATAPLCTRPLQPKLKGPLPRPVPRLQLPDMLPSLFPVEGMWTTDPQSEESVIEPQIGAQMPLLPPDQRSEGFVCYHPECLPRKVAIPLWAAQALSVVPQQPHGAFHIQAGHVVLRCGIP